MQRQTIDVGIDLGTTNSEIAIRKGREAEIIPNNESIDFTPSAVWINKKGETVVGRRAKEAETRDSETNDVYLRFKRDMGEARLFKFARAGKGMRPEELSAEVLKSLLKDARQRIGDIDAAVITVPAGFELPQCEATKRAARLAGLKQSPLLQEPVAAAIAYGFLSESEKSAWLVFDFGGGTFDAALASLRNGFIQILNHAGDNELGGGDIDRELVARYILPIIEKNYRFSDFRFGNDKWKAKLAKLKYEIESAKIRLSQSTRETISIQDVDNWHDEAGQIVEFDLELTRGQVAEVAEPYILRAVKIARQVLAEKHVLVGSIDKVILVGGPTLAPYFREILSDPVAGLGIPLDYSVNPITVVAKGAALFAGTQALERGSSQGRSLAAKKAEGKFVIEFVDYKSIGPELEPPVGGRVTAPFAQSLAGFTLEFCNPVARPPWISGRITLEESGAFMTQLFAVKGSESVFTIQLYDAHGKPVSIEPNEISYTQGPGGVSDVPLIHDIRYETRDGKAPPIISKGTPIPTVVGFDARQVNPVKKGSKDTWIRIPIVEGPSDRANRNTPIGCFEKSGEDLVRDLPADSKLEVTLEMDASRILTIKVLIPLLDQEFQASYSTVAYRVDSLDALQEELAAAERRLDQLRDKAAKTAEPEAWSALEKIETDEMVENAERTLEEAEADPKEMIGPGKKYVKELVIALDDIEDKLAWPALVAESAEAYQYAEGTVSKWGTAEQRQSLAALRGELDKAIAAKDIHGLKQKVEQLYGLSWNINSMRPEWWEGWYDYLKKQRHRMTDQAAASLWIRQGDRALYAKDIEPLSKACWQLRELLPAEEQEKAERFKSTIQ